MRNDYISGGDGIHEMGEALPMIIDGVNDTQRKKG